MNDVWEIKVIKPVQTVLYARRDTCYSTIDTGDVKDVNDFDFTVTLDFEETDNGLCTPDVAIQYDILVGLCPNGAVNETQQVGGRSFSLDPTMTCQGQGTSPAYCFPTDCDSTGTTSAASGGSTASEESSTSATEEPTTSKESSTSAPGESSTSATEESTTTSEESTTSAPGESTATSATEVSTTTSERTTTTIPAEPTGTPGCDLDVGCPDVCFDRPSTEYVTYDLVSYTHVSGNTYEVTLNAKIHNSELTMNDVWEIKVIKPVQEVLFARQDDCYPTIDTGDVTDVNDFDFTVTLDLEETDNGLCTPDVMVQYDILVGICPDGSFHESQQQSSRSLSFDPTMTCQADNMLKGQGASPAFCFPKNCNSTSTPVCDLEVGCPDVIFDTPSTEYATYDLVSYKHVSGNTYNVTLNAKIHNSELTMDDIREIKVMKPVQEVLFARRDDCYPTIDTGDVKDVNDFDFTVTLDLEETDEGLCTPDVMVQYDILVGLCPNGSVHESQQKSSKSISLDPVMTCQADNMLRGQGASPAYCFPKNCD